MILQLTDTFTRVAAALRLEPSDGQSTVAQILDKYLLHCPAGSLLKAGAITEASLRSLRTLQDLVYACDDLGKLTGMFSGIAFKQQGRGVSLEQPPAIQMALVEKKQVPVIDLVFDRTNVSYERNWAGFHRRRWENNPGLFASFVQATLEEALGIEGAEDVLRLDSAERRLRFIKALGRRIWDSDFENYSRFTGDKLMFKTGDETVRNIAAGAGGICTEKVQALKFLTDHYGLESEYLIGGDNAREPVPVNKLREMLTTFDFRFARRYMRYWQHAALLYHVDGVPVLVDATNGNIPFLFLQGADAERMLGYDGKTSVMVRDGGSRRGLLLTTGCPRTYRKTCFLPWRAGFPIPTWYRYLRMSLACICRKSSTSRRCLTATGKNTAGCVRNISASAAGPISSAK